MSRGQLIGSDEKILLLQHQILSYISLEVTFALELMDEESKQRTVKRFKRIAKILEDQEGEER